MPKHPILNDIDIVQVIERRGVSLKRHGKEMLGLCPFHDDTKSSLNVSASKQLYFCPACGAAGDAIDFLTRSGLSFPEAVKELESGIVTAGDIVQVKTVKKPIIKWHNVVPDFIPEKIEHYRHGEPVKTWAYRNSEGLITGYACRFEFEGGTKDVLPYTFKESEHGQREWRWEAFTKYRPLYNLHLLARYPNHPVIIVEGEKTADAVNAACPGVVAVTWPGGSRSVQFADWSVLSNRRLFYWPDNDEPGISAMIHASLIAGPGKFIRVPAEYPKKWDAADKLWAEGECLNFIRQNSGEFPTHESTPEYPKLWSHGTHFSAVDKHGAFIFKQNTAEAQPIPEPIQESTPHPISEPSAPPQIIETQLTNNGHFRFLGFDKSDDKMVYVFFVYGSNQVVKYSASSLTKNNLIALAPINWWESEFPSKKSMDIDAAVNWIIQTSHYTGVYEPDRIRGLGAWIDEGRPVIHCGSKLIVEGIETPLRSHKSGYIYEAKRNLNFDIYNPLESAESVKLIELLKLINWERPVSAHLLAGWCVIAPICGALKWRPHIWITGSAGTGKSWIFQSVIKKMLGNTALAVQGETTEAGIRQHLKTDARPILFDEAEGEDKNAQNRIQNVLNLMRGASTDDGGSIIKGSAGGSAQEFIIRSCFAFASIGIQVQQQSDRSRVTVMSVNSENDKKAADTRWKSIQSAYSVFTNEFCARLRARTINLIPVLMRNAEVFSEAAALELGSQRLGDQLGALIAGAYSLTSKSVVSLENARKWIQERNIQWDEERGLDQTKDEIQLLYTILDTVTSVEGEYGKYDRTIGELISVTAHGGWGKIGMTEAHDRLKRLGIRVLDGHTVMFSNSAGGIKTILKDTPWSKNHGKILQRIEGAKVFNSVRFSPGVETRAVGIPVDFVVKYGD